MTIQGLTWAPETAYSVGDYVYPTSRNNFYYTCIIAGTSHSTTKGYNGTFEPNWLINVKIYDGELTYDFVEDKNIGVTWDLYTEYEIGDYIYPTSGPVEWGGKKWCYKVIDVKYEPDWSKDVGTKIVDGTVTWETKISSAFYLPEARRVEDLFIQTYEQIDYISETQKIELILATSKYLDSDKLTSYEMNSIIAELGYSYITDIFLLDEEDLRVLLGYLGLIHFLKGSLQGLKLVMDLLSVYCVIEEWWEQDPVAEPVTFRMEVDLNLSKAKSESMNSLASFIQQYVYPQLSELVLSYYAELAEISIFAGGFHSSEEISSIGINLTMWPPMQGLVDHTIMGTVVYYPQGYFPSGYVIEVPSEDSLYNLSEESDDVIVT